jgi:hypothetical protein
MIFLSSHLFFANMQADSADALPHHAPGAHISAPTDQVIPASRC